MDSILSCGHDQPCPTCVQSSSWPLHDLSLPCPSIFGWSVLFWVESWESFRVTESWLMVGCFSSPTDETVLFNFHLQVPLYHLHELWVLYAFYGTQCVGLVVHLVKEFGRTHIQNFTITYKIFITLTNWAISPRTSCRGELHANELTGLHIVWHTAAALALLGGHEIHVRMLQTISSTHYPTLWHIHNVLVWS